MLIIAINPRTDTSANEIPNPHPCSIDSSKKNKTKIFFHFIIYLKINYDLKSKINGTLLTYNVEHLYLIDKMNKFCKFNVSNFFLLRKIQ